MFTMQNTEGFTQADLDLMNKAVATLMARGFDEANASDRVNNNWRPTDNTVESLMGREPSFAERALGDAILANR